jgi:multidrug transporter EmrE-like cation transporter
MIFAVILTGISQVLLKIGSAHQGKQKYSIFAAYLNFHTITAYVLLLCVTVVTVIALKEIPLKLAYAIASLSFVTVGILSWGILKEEVNMKMIGGMVLIVIGIVIFNIPI